MTVGASHVPPPPRSIFSGPLRTTSGGILILITLIAFEAMAVSAALPTAARELHGLGGYGWAFTGFLVANVVGMVVSGQVSDSHGPRAPLVAGMIAFVAGLVVAGTATTMTQLVAGRVVQGLGSGLLITATYVVIGEMYPAVLRPKVFAAIASGWVLPSLLGPIIAGTLTQHASWRWVFLGLLPFVLVGAGLMVPVLRTLHGPPGGRTSRLADPRRILHALAVAAGIAALEDTGQHPSPVSIAVAVIGLVALVWGLRTLLPAGTIRLRRGVPAPIAMRGLLAGAFFGVESIVPLSLSVQYGYSATAAGLPLACSGLSWAFGSWWQGRGGHADEQAHRVRLVRTGFVLIALAAVGVAVAVQPGVGGWLIYPAWGLAGIGAGLTMTSVSVLLLNYTTDADRGADSAALQLSDATASAVTTGVAGVLVAAAARGTLGYTAAFTILDLAMAGIALVGVLVAGQVRAPTTRLAP
ncbi:MAG: Major Facilitator Superfamily arabinose transporter [Pseudonocardiales bacterium]|nr:Major Facilitator Superfamily arabinose transporter [Pseudonocardiales bacterium]